MVKTFLLCLLVLLVAFQVEGRKRYKYVEPGCKIKVVTKNNGDFIKYTVKGNCASDLVAWVKDRHNLNRRLTAV